jgi:hypothetical protein
MIDAFDGETVPEHFKHISRQPILVIISATDVELEVMHNLKFTKGVMQPCQ